MSKNRTKKHQVNLQHSATARFAITVVAFAAATTACGSSGSSSDSDASSGAAEAADLVESADAVNEVSEASQEETVPVTGDEGMATLTFEDGTSFEFELTSCDTSDTDPNAFPLSNGFETYGNTADGVFSIGFSRAGLDDDSVFAGGGFDGELAEDGEETAVIYSMRSDTLDVTIDGGHVSASFVMGSVGQDAPYGEESTVSLEADC